MVKTTVNLDDDLYRRAVSESVRRYGNTRSLSTVINDLLRSGFLEGARKEGNLSGLWGLLKGSRAKSRLTTQELKDLARAGWE
ncbi:MAG: hypothetical protein WCX64_05000 [Candidatus Micrarchaeia archaeon]